MENMSLLLWDILRSCGGTTGEVRRSSSLSWVSLNLELWCFDCPSGSWDWSLSEFTNSVVTIHRHDVCHLWEDVRLLGVTVEWDTESNLREMISTRRVDWSVCLLTLKYLVSLRTPRNMIFSKVSCDSIGKGIELCQVVYLKGLKGGPGTTCLKLTRVLSSLFICYIG
jgi:hypothetical protein